MMSLLFLVVATAAVLSAYTVIGRLAVPPEDRVPWRRLGWDGWLHTLRRSLAFLADGAPGRRRSPEEAGREAVKVERVQ